MIDIFTQAEVGCRMGESDPLHLLREQSKRCMGETEAFSVECDAYIREGSPRPVIVESALEFDCQMIVMGTHGRSGLVHLLLGSVAPYGLCALVPRAGRD